MIKIKKYNPVYVVSTKVLQCELNKKCDQKRPDCQCCQKKHDDSQCCQKKSYGSQCCQKKHNDCICDEKKHDDCHLCHKKHNDCQCDLKNNLVRASAFRANKSTTQRYEAAVTPFVKVLYQTEQFDLANEYNPHISTFIPTENGIYEITAKASFCPSKSKKDNSSKHKEDHYKCDYCKKDHCKCDYCKKDHCKCDYCKKDHCKCDYYKKSKSSKDKKKHSSKEEYVASISIYVNGDVLDIENGFFDKSRTIGLSVTTILQLQAGDRVEVIFSAGANGEILAGAPLTNFQAVRFPSPM
ncbi:hypothetical protein [Peribacillus frigoritolerans]|uniref:hypothetical protein n=1 Tax=Peribacillus frigoritolerans TaxID=450367 RepID=UPI00399C7FDF